MVSPLFFYQLCFLALLWLCIMLHYRWPSDRAAHRQSPSQPASPPHKRSREPTPFAGLTHKPLCDACAQAVEPRPPTPSAPPPRLSPTQGRRRQVDTSRHFCPDPDCAYRGWLGLGNISANGLPTICQPRFVTFLPHLHGRLTTNSAGIIAGTIPQHGREDTQQSIANTT